jgi:hypothetical protein
MRQRREEFRSLFFNLFFALNSPTHKIELALNQQYGHTPQAPPLYISPAGHAAQKKIKTGQDNENKQKNPKSRGGGHARRARCRPLTLCR